MFQTKIRQKFLHIANLSLVHSAVLGWLEYNAGELFDRKKGVVCIN